MRRRKFISGIFGMITLPVASRAQHPALPVVGFLSGHSPYPTSLFADGLKQAGLVEGQNVKIEYRWAGGQYDRLPALAADLVSRQVAVIAAGSLPAAFAAKQATTTIPIVFHIGGDPVQLGLVDSLNRPTGNITGVTNFHDLLGAKRLELLRELVPTASVVAYLINPRNPNIESHSSKVQSAARAMNQQILLFNASSESEVDATFATLAQRGARALLVGDDPFFDGRAKQFATLAARYAMPAMYYNRHFVAGGGLISYGVKVADQVRQHGVYTGQILKGANPADLPVVQPTKFELVVNLKAAKALGITFTPSLLARADEVIE